VLDAILLDIYHGITSIFSFKTIYGGSPGIIRIYSSYGYRTEELEADRLAKEKMFAVSILRRLIDAPVSFYRRQELVGVYCVIFYQF
jgi:hypothetical protein